VSIWRRGATNIADPLITLNDGVILFENVRLVVSNRDESQFAGIRIGKRVVVNVGSFLSGEGGLDIEDEVLIGAHVRVLTAGHSIDLGHESIMRNPITYAPVRIGRGAWLGAGCTILQGKSVGYGAAVGAGSVVTRDVPPLAVVVGHPARIIRFRGESARPAKKNLFATLYSRLLSRIR
jgi:galactoside O-acetyltransferase